MPIGKKLAVHCIYWHICYSNSCLTFVLIQSVICSFIRSFIPSFHSFIQSVSQINRIYFMIRRRWVCPFVHVFLCRWTSRIQHCHGTQEWSCGWMQATTWQLAASWEQAVVNESVETVIFNDLGLSFNQVVSSDMMCFTQFASFCTTRVCVVWYFYIMFFLGQIILSTSHGNHGCSNKPSNNSSEACRSQTHLAWGFRGGL